MSHFQIGLAIVGGLVLAFVVAQSAWSSRSSLPKQADQPQDATNDSTEAVQNPQEPGELLSDQDPVDTSSPQEPGLDEEDFSPAFLKTVVARRAPLDALIDVIAPVNLDPAEEAIAGEVVIAALPSTRRVGTKPFAVDGFNEDTQTWEAPQAGSFYSAFQSGVQLANRSGALDDIEYSEFVVKTQAFADAIGATPEIPEMRDEVARARELDHFASQSDAQLGVNLRARNASWSPGYVHQIAAQHGFVAGQLPGRMVLPALTQGLPPILSLTFDSQAAMAEDPAQSAIRELIFHLDVPQVDRDAKPFQTMCLAAQAMAQTMDGSVTDDNGHALSTQSLQSIANELERLYSMLEQRELAAGSLLARRLFS
jgi:hypothetical protein